MFVKSIFMCLLALSLFYTTTGSRSLKLLGDTSDDINDIIQDFLGGVSSPSSPFTGVESPFLDILRISTGGGNNDDGNDDGNPFQDFFGRIQDLADEPGSALGSIFQGSGINLRDLLRGAGY
eukprot:TRINITY_DN1675_c0_g1_i3.p2 TRINITY_DN1675_c0_g1~~TRINITY_DN1675_c0_g1_i3.p2  ORF type:complete len:122 (+),score=16.21 TRINITY_DN1675_c0_g1_i3:147-512(+)